VCCVVLLLFVVVVVLVVLLRWLLFACVFLVVMLDVCWLVGPHVSVFHSSPAFTHTCTRIHGHAHTLAHTRATHTLAHTAAHTHVHAHAPAPQPMAYNQHQALKNCIHHFHKILGVHKN